VELIVVLVHVTGARPAPGTDVLRPKKARPSGGNVGDRTVPGAARRPLPTLAAVLNHPRLLVVPALAAVLALAAACGPAPQAAPAPTIAGQTSAPARPSATASATGTPSASPTPLTTDAEAQQIVAQAQDALHATSSYRVTGTVVDVHGTATVDIVYVGESRQGTWTNADGPVQIIKVGGTTYVNAGATFWQQAFYPDAAAQMAGRWMVLSGSYEDLAAPLVPDIEEVLSAGTFTKGATDSVGGTPVTTLTDGTTTVFVASDSPPYPLRIEGRDGTALNLSAFGAPAIVQAPDGASALNS
jgi:hypothetical protein